MPNKILFSGSSDKRMAKLIAKEAKIEFGQIEIKNFASGEKYINLIENVKDKIVYIYQTATQTPDNDLVELMLIANAGKLALAKKIIAIIPNLPYSRQDHLSSEKHQEPVSAKLIADMLKVAGINKVITVHAHSSKVLDFYKIEIINIETTGLFAKRIKDTIVNLGNSLSEYVVVSPDKGGIGQVKKMAVLLGGLKVAHFEKIRSFPGKETNVCKTVKLIGDIKGKRIIIFDDMIDTCGTIVNAKKSMEEEGIKDIILCATHPVLSGSAIEKLKTAGFSHIFTTDSIPLRENFKEIKVISLVKEIVKAI